MKCLHMHINAHKNLLKMAYLKRLSRMMPERVQYNSILDFIRIVLVLCYEEKLFATFVEVNYPIAETQ